MTIMTAAVRALESVPAIGDPARVGLSPARLTRVREWMQRHVDAGRLPCAQVLVARRGEAVFLEQVGHADVEAGLPAAPDTVFRIYSMTKPITAVAALMLYEEGAYQLDDPLEAYLPAFADARVHVGGLGVTMRTKRARRPIEVRDLFCHTAGLTYGSMRATPVDALYREHGVDFSDASAVLADLVDRVAALPLLAHPGEAWNYSVGTDVLGRLVEVLSGQSLERFMRERIFVPLAMHDTGFSVRPGAEGRLAALYAHAPGGGYILDEAPRSSRFTGPVTLHSGGGGLVSTIGDYHRFTQMLRGRGTLDGERLLSRKSVELMTRNHLPGNRDMAAMGQPRHSETTYAGMGFGLAVSVMLDPAAAGILGSPGEYAWGGAASTAFWVDPVEDMSVILMTQLLPASALPLRRQLRVLTYQAIDD